MQTITATIARSNLFQLLKNILNSHLPTRISSKSGNVVVIPEEDYESLVETAKLLSTPGLKKSLQKADNEIKKGEIYSIDNVFSN